MKRFAIAIAALVVAVTAQPVKAASINLGNITAYDNLSIPLGTDAGLYQHEIIGYLPSNKVVTFTYSLAPAPAPTAFGAAMISGLASSANLYNVSANAGVNVPYLLASETISSGDGLLTVMANMDSLASGKTVMTNISDLMVSIRSAITYALMTAGTLTIGINVSSVPLPAALPLFGLGIASLAGYRMRKKKAA